jgi:hypothetical protein
VDNHTVQLRAERAGGSTRVYTITITCTDAAGQAKSSEVTVIVPASQGK